VASPASANTKNRQEGNPMKIPCIAAAMLLACSSAVHAQDFPTRPITILVGVAPGGITDLATRAYANAVSKHRLEDRGGEPHRCRRRGRGQGGRECGT
jgi:hypothetical protein